MKTFLAIFIIGVIICAILAAIQAFKGVENAIFIWIAIIIFLLITRNKTIL